MILLSFDETEAAVAPGAASPASTCSAACRRARSTSCALAATRLRRGSSCGSELESFREAFIAHAAQALGPEELTRTERIDALVGGDGWGWSWPTELERLGTVRLRQPRRAPARASARLGDVKSMGDGKHSRFSLQKRRGQGGRSRLRSPIASGRRQGGCRRCNSARSQPVERRGRAPRRPQRALPASRRYDRRAASRLQLRRRRMVAALRSRVRGGADRDSITGDLAGDKPAPAGAGGIADRDDGRARLQR